MDPLTLMALATIVQTGVGMHKQQKQQGAAKAAQTQGQIDASIKQSELLGEGYKKKRKQQGTILGGEVASQEGTMLGSSSQKQSLLG
jgi:hypothetical protein